MKRLTSKKKKRKAKTNLKKTVSKNKKKTNRKQNKKKKAKANKKTNINSKRKTNNKSTKKANKKAKSKVSGKTKRKKIKKNTEKTKKKPSRRKTNIKNIEVDKKRKAFIIPSVLITVFLFVFFQLSSTFNKNFAKGISQSDHSIDESQIEQPLITDEEDSFVAEVQEVVEEGINEPESIVEENSNENANKVDEKEPLNEEQDVVSEMVNDTVSLKEKSDNELVKMIDEGSFSPTQLQEELINFLNKQLLNGPYQVKAILDQSQSIIISGNEIQNDLNTAVSKHLEDNYCSKCHLQIHSICDSCVEESKNHSYIPGQQICKNDLPIAYNAPGRIDICGGIKSFIVAEFIYWEQLSDQLDLGTVNITSTTPQEFEILKFKTDYQPGFKIGIGTHFKRDDWDLFVQYTRLHKTENTIFDPSSKTGTFNTPWFHTNINQFTLANITTDIKSTWKIDLDKIDLELGRAYYLGSSLILRPFASLSGHILNQRYDLSLTTTQLFSSSTKNDSWSIGPRFGLSTNWFFCRGFSLFGHLALSLLYAENEISGSGDENQVTYKVKKIDKYILRDVEELKLGFAWGSYFTNNKWHFNLSAAYEAQRYSHTNYMSYASQINLEANEVKPGDLFLHGLSVAARFDF
ncbi:MAG: hypothetical protein K940chlam5_01117 [Candidatus Anoxychlamydiales bacterium]|nr:hypothetical protein [Candidatus Anoxychlamydiales bacterium]